MVAIVTTAMRMSERGVDSASICAEGGHDAELDKHCARLVPDVCHGTDCPRRRVANLGRMAQPCELDHAFSSAGIDRWAAGEEC
jgi:hypothetical protein